ncbi:sigma-70 family RNA polymerase sigma factor [Propionibacteriaceae bacterium Y2011]
MDLPDIPLLAAEDEHRLAKDIEAGVLAVAQLRGPTDDRAGTEEELRALVELGRRAEQRFLGANLRLVKMVSGRAAHGTHLAEEDLFQEGVCGLAVAVRRFDHRRGVRFATYALPWIRAAVTDAIAGAETVRQASRWRAHRREVAEAEADLANTLRRQPTRRETAAALGRSPAWLASLPTNAPVVSLEVLPGLDVVDPSSADEFADTEWAASCGPLLERLPELQRRIIELRYGFTGDPLTYVAIARGLDLGAATVRRLELQALAELRSQVAATGQRTAA